MTKIKLFDTFSGVGGFHLALEEAAGKENIELIGFSEIDQFAKQTYLKNFPGAKDFGDITKINFSELPDFDLLTGGFPCQDVSVAGKQNLEGGRTILVEYLLRILEEKKPKYFVFENVKGLLNKKFTIFRESIFERIKDAGYNFRFDILNTKEHGLPQNRERVFIVGVYGFGNNFYTIPEKEELKTFLKDILENEVDESFFLNEKQVEKIKNSNFIQEKRRIQEKNVCETLLARDYKDPKCAKIMQLNDPKHSINRIYDENGISPTINTCGGGNRQVKIYPYFRKLTPLEYERLQGFPDNWTQGVSKTQRYKQMGNAISVPVVRKIFENLFDHIFKKD